MLKNLYALTGCVALLVLSSCGGGSDTTSPTIGPLASVSISSPAATVVIGGSAQLSAVGSDAQAHTVPGTTFTWSSSNNAVATVNANGVVTGVAVGNVTITATATGTAIAGTKVLSVTTVPASASVAATTSNSFEPEQVDINAGGTVTWQFGSTEHNVTFLTSAAGTPSNIGNLSNNSASRTFTNTGTFTYHCTLHAGMNGTVVVH